MKCENCGKEFKEGEDVIRVEITEYEYPHMDCGVPTKDIKVCLNCMPRV